MSPKCVIIAIAYTQLPWMVLTVLLSELSELDNTNVLIAYVHQLYSY